MSLLRRLRKFVCAGLRADISRRVTIYGRLSLECLEDRTLLSGLVAGVPPANNFTLSNWYLTLPTGASSHPDTISTSKLVAGYSSPYFYTGSDGAMVFWANVTGVTTKNSSYPRSELRETKSDGSLYNWNVADGLASMTATLAVNQVPSTGRIIIGQIHDNGANGISDQPIIKLVYKFDSVIGSGSIVAEVRSLPASAGNTNYTLLTDVALDTQFSYQIQLGADRVMRVKINGVDLFSQMIDPSWLSQAMYFKAGAYVQDNVGPSTEGGRASFYQLTVTHGAFVHPNAPPTVTVRLNSAAPLTNDVVTATATPADADDDPVRLTYVWKVNGQVVQTHVQNTTTDTLDLSQAGYGNVGDAITVTVTPSDGLDSGNPFVTPAAVVANTAPALNHVSIASSAPTTRQTLVADVSSHDDDGNTVSYAYQWLRNGAPIDGENGSTLDLAPLENGDKGDVITLTVTPNDGTTDGVAITSDEVTIANTAPVVDSVTVTPEHPAFNQRLMASVISRDDDGDPVRYDYQWLRNGIEITGANNASLDLMSIDTGDSFSVVVTPNDGMADGLPVASATVTVKLVLTVSSDVAISPSAPTTNQVLSAMVSNHDGDTFSYQWFKNGVAIPGQTAPSLDLSLDGNGAVGDAITVAVIPNNGIADGDEFAAPNVVVQNTAPVVTKAIIDKSAPTTNQTISALVDAKDDDGDIVSYRYRWFRNDTEISGQIGSTLDLSIANNGDKGDLIRVEVIANDGIADSTALTSDPVTIANSGPVIGNVAFTSSAPTTKQTLVAQVTGLDDDGDIIRYRFQWYKNHVAINGETGSSLDLSVDNHGDKGDVIDVIATPNDGTSDGTPLPSATVTVQNTAPVVSIVVIDNSHPTTNQTLTAHATSQDDDGDMVSYRYRWFKNDVEISGQTGATLDLSLKDNGAKGDSISVAAIPTDYISDGTEVRSAAVTVQNAAPILGSVVIDRSHPTTNQIVTAMVTGRDDDGDPLTYSYAWFKNNTLIVNQTASSLDLSLAGNGAQGDIISVDVIPNDGALGGSALVSSGATIVGDPPIGTTATLPNVSAAASFQVTWSGSGGDSPIAFYDVYASDSGGPFSIWQTQTTTTSAIFSGSLGHSYAFYCRATDVYGNLQTGAPATQAATFVTGHNWTLRRNGGNVEIVDASSSRSVFSQPLGSTAPIWFAGADSVSDTLTIDFTFGGAFAVAGGVRFDGGAGANDQVRFLGNTSGIGNLLAGGALSLAGINLQTSGLENVFVSNLPDFTLRTAGGNDVITVSSPAAGQNLVSGTSGGIAIPAVTFAGVANFTLDTSAGDAAGSADAITISSSGFVAVGLRSVHLVTGAGQDTLTLQTVNFNLPSAGGSFTFDGGSENDGIVALGNVNFTLSDALLTSSGGGSISLSSVNVASLTGGSSANTLNAAAFSGDVVLDGGAGNDIISGGSGNDVLTGGTGNDTINGNGGFDTLVEAANASFTLTDTSLSGNGSDILSGIEAARLTGGSSGNTFTVSGWTGAATLDGAGGINTLVSVNDADFTLSDTALIRSNGGVFNLTGFEKATLTGGAGNNSFNLIGWSGDASVSGSSGTADRLIMTGNVDFTLANSSLTLSTGRRISLSGVELATLTGGASDNLFIVTGWTGSATLDGAGGIDKIVSSKDANFTLTDSLLTISTGGAFNLTSFEAADLTGGGGNNTLNASAFSGFTYLNGGSGNDILWAGAGGSILLGGTGNDTLNGNSGRDLLFGGRDTDALSGGAGDDLLISGTTTFDSNRAAQDAVFAFWNRRDLDFAARVAQLKAGIAGVPAFSPTTVLSDTAHDTLTGGSELDWYFATLPPSTFDTITDLQSGEVRN